MTRSERKRNRGGWFFLTGIGLAHGALALVDAGRATRAWAAFVGMLGEILPVLLLVFGLLFLSERFLTLERTRTWLGRESGSRGWALAVLGGVVSTGPVYAWYSLLGELRARGMRRALIATLLYARALKLPLLPLLVHYFGLGYVIVLSGLLVLFALGNGWLVERLVPPAEGG